MAENVILKKFRKSSKNSKSSKKKNTTSATKLKIEGMPTGTALSPPLVTPPSDQSTTSGSTTPSQDRVVVTTTTEPITINNHPPTTKQEILRKSIARSNSHDYEDGLLMENTVEFQGINFCFKCDDEVVLNEEGDKNWSPIASIKITGWKFCTNSDGCDRTNVYRKVYLCPRCEKEAEDSKKTDGIVDSVSTVVITPRAMTYYHPVK